MNKALKSLFPVAVQTVFLDRDGVINEKMPEGCYVTRWDEFHVLPDVGKAVRLLNQSGIRVIVVSNQRGIALGLYTAETVRAIHAEFESFLKVEGAHVDGFYFCPHDNGQCECRKPLSGMFEQAVADFPTINAATCVMIGDSKSDMEFGRRLGMITAFIVGLPERQKSDAEVPSEMADLLYSSLYEAVCDLLTRSGP